MKTVKNTQKEMDLVYGLLVIAANKDELSADMSLGEFLDWMTVKLSNDDLADTIVKLSRNENIDILDITDALMILNPDDLPHSVEEIRKMDPYEVKYEMESNEDFYYNTLDVCKDQIARLIKDEKKTAEKRLKKGQIKKGVYNKIQKANTIDSLISSGFYGDDYDMAKQKVIDKLVDDYLCKKPSPRK